MKKLFVLGLLSLLSTGCYEMTIRNGDMPGGRAADKRVIDEAWRSSAVLDVVPIDTPIHLESVCKDTPWTTIHQELTALNWLVDVVLAGAAVYESSRVSVWCAAEADGPTPGTPATPPPPADGAPTPAPTQL